MTKILVVCGNGLGSSFMLKLNVKKALMELKKEAEVAHTDLTSANIEQADIFLAGEDISGQLTHPGRTVVPIYNMMSIREIKDKIDPLL